MKPLARSHIALILTVIYCLIIMIPLATRVMDSKTVAIAKAAECTGDCATCGCRPESMATGTCCCMKKQQKTDASPDCDQKSPDREQVVIASCGCGSGNGKHVALPSSEISELLPCYFNAKFGIPSSDTRFPLLTNRVTSFQDEPPDPPPKIAIYS